MQPKVNTEPPTVESLRVEIRTLRDRFCLVESNHNTLKDAFLALRHAICKVAWAFESTGNKTGEDVLDTHRHMILNYFTHEALKELAALDPTLNRIVADLGPLPDKDEGAHERQEARS